MKSSAMMSLRIDPETRRAIARLARARRQSQSEIVREAVARLIERAPDDDDRPYDEWVSVIGIARGGAPDLSTRTGARFAALLRAGRSRQ